MKLPLIPTPNHITIETDNIQENTELDSTDNTMDSTSDSKWLYQEHEIIRVKLSNTKYAVNFSVTINNKISLFDTGAKISCVSKACFDKLDPKLPLTETHTYKVNGADSNSLSPLGTTTCTLEFPKMLEQQFIVCEHLLRPLILGLDFSHNYLIGISWFSTKQLHLHQGPWLIVVSDPMPFPLHIIKYPHCHCHTYWSKQFHKWLYLQEH